MSSALILAIDDDEMVLNYLRRMLGSRYTVITSSNPATALELAQSEKPDLILCDIDMPEMDGGAVGAALAKNPATAHIPLMFLTSLVSPSEVQELDGIVGGKPGISKRASLSEMIASIDAQLPRRQ